MDDNALSAVYRERAHLVAHLAAVYPSRLGTDPAEPEWPVLYVDTPEGQLSWHIAPSDLALFAHVPRDPAAVWDGHTTAEKYRRLDAHTRALAGRRDFVLVNLTPHPIRLYADEREDGIDDLDLHLRQVIDPEELPARLLMHNLGTQADGTARVEYGHAVDLRPPQEGVRYVVSLVLALALGDRRNDLLVPYREVRNGSGTVIGCRQLAQPV